MKLTRRHAVLGCAAALGAAAIPRQATATRPGTAFGTTVRLTVTAATSAQAEAAIDAGFQEIRAIEKTFSLFDRASDLSRLNAMGHLAALSPLMRELANISDTLWRTTQGAFDPSVQPLWTVWQDAAQRHALPAKTEINEARARTGWRNVTLDRSGIRLKTQGNALTFNGIAQGYAADRVTAALIRAGASSAIADTGEIGLLSESGARFAIRHPRHENGIIGYIHAGHGFLATSGDYQTTFSRDFTHHHIFDPAQGRSPDELASVTVLAPTGAEADGLATAFMVMGSSRCLAFAARAPGVEALLVDKRGRTAMTDGMASFFIAA